MPELPEVETIASDLIAAPLIGKVIEDVWIHWPRTIALPTPTEFRDRLIGQWIVEIARRGKYLKLALSGGETLLIHLRMTGRLQLIAVPAKPVAHTCLTLLLQEGQALIYSDPRKFGRWYLVKDPQEVLGKLGPEPLGEAFTPSFLAHLLASKSRQIKPLLLDQSCIAGLGNIYVDEALWLAQVHPLAISSDLTQKQVAQLHSAIQEVLNRGLKTAGTTLGTGQSNFYRLSGERGSHQKLLQVFRRTGEPCPRCQTAIERIVVAMRSTHLCPRCQSLLFKK